MQSIFHHFLNNLWNFKLDQTQKVFKMMSPEERLEFKIDVSQFDWKTGVANSIYGLRRFYLKEDILPPESSYI